MKGVSLTRKNLFVRLSLQTLRPLGVPYDLRPKATYLMPNSFRAHKSFLPRIPFLILLLFSVISTSGCSGLFGTHKRVQVPQLLTPLVEADKPQLLQEVNRLASVKSIHGKVDLIFEDNSFAETGIAEK